MAKSLILANGNIFVGLDKYGLVSDFFFPFVGVENHVRGAIHKIGIYVNNRLSWLDSGEWSIDADLKNDTFIGIVTCHHSESNITIIFKNGVYNDKNIFMRNVEVINHSSETKHIRVFFHQAFCIYGTPQEDTAYYDAEKNAIIHYEGRRVFFIYAESSDVPFDDYTVGLYGIEGKEGTWRDAEDGQLSKNGIEHGRVDSTLSLPLILHKGETKEIHYYITVAETKIGVYELHDYIKLTRFEHILSSTEKFWKAWLKRHDALTCSQVSERQMELFKKSLFYMRANIDNGGAIIASGDSDMLQHGRDTYSYMWPRDGAMTVMALLDVGEHNVSKHFFKFCNDVLEPDGYLMHKYRSDKSLGSSWEPFVRDGAPILPIQEDETALVLVALWEYYSKTKDIEFIDIHYYSVIKKMSNFLCEYTDKDMGLPKPSYDLWEEKYGISTFTASAVYAGLVAATHFANLFEKENTEQKYHVAAEKMKASILAHLYDEDRKTFIKLINIAHGKISYDTTIDMSSVYAIFAYGVLPIDDERVISSIATIEEKLRIHTGIDGIPRYENDAYYMQAPGIPNPWYITTLWLARYYALSAKNAKDLEKVTFWLDWAVTHSPKSGVLSEQLHPFTGEQLSANPLTWSHAEYVRLVVLYNAKCQEFGLCNTIT